MWHHLCRNHWRRLGDDKWPIDQMTNAKPAKQTICVAWQRSFQHVIDIWPSVLRRVQSRIRLNQPRRHVWCLNVCRWPLSAQAEFPSESVTSLTCQMAEETAMSCDSARQVCEKEHVLDYFKEYLLSNLLMLCAKLFSLFLKDLNNLKYPPNFCEMGQIVMLLAGLHLALLLTGGPVFEIVGLAWCTTFVGTTGEGWKMTSEPLTRICVAYFIRIRCSLFPSFQGQHIWCLNLCRWAPLTQAESQSESETSNTCQMAEEIEMSFDCGFQLVQVCQKPSRITYFFSCFVQSCLYSFFLTAMKISLSTCQSFWVFRQIVLYLPISYQWLKLQDLHVAPPLSEPLKKAGRWQVTHWHPLTKW